MIGICNCAGTYTDSDNDGVCDKDDICPGFDDNADSDGDGTPDGCDDCDGSQAGQPCNDLDDCTEGDVYDANCNCAGTYTDSDNDGVCDKDDICPGFDDNADSDGDGIPDGCDVGGGPANCDNIQVTVNGNKITVSGLTAASEIVQYLGAGTNWAVVDVCDGDCPDQVMISNLSPGSYIVKVQMFGDDRSYCYFDKREIEITDGGTGCDDNDGDGICVADDCDDNNDQIGGVGGACDDGDSNTTNDKLQADCSCKGTPSGGNGNCDDVQAVGGDGQIIVTGLTAAEQRVQIIGANTGWQVVDICDKDCSDPLIIDNLAAGAYTIKIFMYGINCYREVKDVSVGEGGGTGCDDNDGDGVCAADDCDDNNDQIGSIGSTCDDGDENTSNDRLQADCSCKGTPDGGTGGDCDAITIQEGNGEINIGNFGGAIPLIKVWDKNNGWINTTYCDDEVCGDPYTIMTGSGGFKVEIKLYSDRIWGTEVCTRTEDHVEVSGSRNAAQLAFAAFAQQQEVALQWATNTGWKNSYYEVQRSLDGLQFNTIAEFSNLDLTDELITYNQVDAQPAEGLNHYRLKQVYKDGDFDYTEIQQVNFNKLPDFGIYPNPASEEAFINLSKFGEKSVQLTVYDSFGKEVLKQMVQTNNTNHRIDTKGFGNGLYMVRVALDGKKAVSKKLLIARLY